MMDIILLFHLICYIIILSNSQVALTSELTVIVSAHTGPVLLFHLV